MKSILSGTAIALALLSFNAAASAQHGGGHAYNGGRYGQTFVQPHYPQHGYASNLYIQSPHFGASFGYSTPSFGLGINYGQGYGSNIHAQPGHVPNYYPSSPIVSWPGQHPPQRFQYGGH
ncbi:MAG: hypothetical protein K2X38_06470 [Gemmataceae bacterium]|nr:hypothetical protein [Gemmataceae bacterium]